jgi:hypothetical protein
MENKDYLAQILPQLKKEMPYKWRVQSFSKNKPQATCVAYIDARDVMDRLDEVCVHGWERLHNEFKGHLYSGISIVMPNGERFTRWDCGVESNTDAEKGEASDSFKRAAVNWGIGRFLYDLGMEYVAANEAKTNGNYPYCVDAAGKKIYDLTKHINLLKQTPQKPKEPANKVPYTQAIFDRMKAAIEAGNADAVKASLHRYDISVEFMDELNKLLK